MLTYEISFCYYTGIPVRTLYPAAFCFDWRVDANNERDFYFSGAYGDWLFDGLFVTR